MTIVTGSVVCTIVPQVSMDDSTWYDLKTTNNAAPVTVTADATLALQAGVLHRHVRAARALKPIAVLAFLLQLPAGGHVVEDGLDESGLRQDLVVLDPVLVVATRFEAPRGTARRLSVMPGDGGGMVTMRAGVAFFHESRQNGG